MRILRAWYRRFVSLFDGDRLDRELNEELDAHVQYHVQDNRRLGMSEVDARRHAMASLGGLQQTLEQCRERRGVPAVDNLVRDLRYSIRRLAWSPAFTGITAAALALGIGGTTAMFAIVNAVLVRPLPFPEPNQLVMIWERPPRSENRNVVAMPTFVAWQERSRSFEAMAAFNRTPINLIGAEESLQVAGAAVTADFFTVLGVNAMLGRTFAAGEDGPGAAPVAVLSHAFWRQRFGGRADTIGQRLSLNARHHQIVGVLPPGHAFPDREVQVFIPLRTDRSEGRNHAVVARLRPNVDVSAARDEMIAIARRFAEEHPVTNADWSASVIPLHEQLVGDSRRALLILLAAVACVLLIACSNVASLLLIRWAGRTREVEIRLALGASRGRVIHQLLVESAILAVFGAALGVALAAGAVRGLALVPPTLLSIPRLHEVLIDATVIAFVAVVTIATTLVFGTAPSLSIRRGGARSTLRTSDRTTTPAHRRIQAAMVIAEVALAVPLLAGAGLMAHSLFRLHRVEPGFRAEGVLTIRMKLLPVRDRHLHAEFVDSMLERIRARPEVIAAGSIGALPMTGRNSGSWYYRADRPEPPLARRPAGDISIVTPGYFRAMGIPVVRGRDFDTTDRAGATRVAIVNETAARKFFPGEDALGKRLSVSWNDARDVEIVGVAGDVRHAQLQAAPVPCLFLPNAQQPFPFTALVIRTHGNPAAFANIARDEIRGVDPDQGIGEVATMEQLVEDVILQPTAQAVLLTIFGSVALALASIGVYGVLAYSVAQRTREIGIRIALGAAPASAFRFVLGEGLRLTAAGLLIGLGAALVLTRSMQNLLFEVTPLDPIALGAVVVLLTSVAAVACAVPAARASWIDPATVLRQD